MPTVWWVNQGASYDQERKGGYVWAPTKTRGGFPVAHHQNVSRLSPGDAIVHYANGHIRAIGIVRENAGTQERPAELPTEPWEKEGYLARVDYHDLSRPIPLSEIPARTADAGPFNGIGGVNQGYLYPLSATFTSALYDAFVGRWPLAWLPRTGGRPVWLFQANPSAWNIEQELPKIGVGGEDTWTVSRLGSEMQPGDTVVLWKSGDRAGVYGLAEIVGSLTTRATPEWRRGAISDPTEPAVPLRYTRYLTKPLLRSELLDDPVLAQMTVIRAPQGTNFRLTSEEWQALKKRLGMEWDEFIYWARRIKEWPRFDTAERDYKVRLGTRLAEAREKFLGGATEWRELVKRALRSRDNNLTNWQVHQPFITWLDSEEAAARSGLTPLWEAAEPTPAAIDGFANATADVVTGGISGLVSLAAVLTMATNASQFPPYRKKPFFSVYDLTRFGRPPADATSGEVWQHAMTFLDRLLQEAKERGLDLRDRLDAQSITWVIGKKHELSDWSDADRQRYQAFLRGARPSDEPDGDDDDSLDGLDALATELLLDVDYLRRVEKLLRHKRQVIFYGPPGTGKTYVAKRLAEYFADSGGAVEKVQFHPSYAYEDFVEGYRPRLIDRRAGFELIHGPLRRVAEVARKHVDSTYVLLIDEINRGNVAKVFGELYYLLEYRNEEISLLYSEEPMSLPPNLWIIGTMNTADRSIALVDAALRRRFHFVPFYPDRPPVEGLLRRWLQKHKPEMTWVADVVDRANAALGSGHMAIGPSHFLRDDLTDDWVELIWEHSVLPYIAEQFFGDEARVENFALAKLRSFESSGATPQVS